MTQKTVNKLLNICEPYGVEIDMYQDSWGDWSICFHAPPMHAWNSSTCSSSGWPSRSLKGIVGYLRRELAEGLYELDPNDEHDREVLLDTGQI
tara:strand:- start:330 stop:608 length:279 start_codon:yes stop_codon:yes gene_type:complete